jgi:hypothetical protein
VANLKWPFETARSGGRLPAAGSALLAGRRNETPPQDTNDLLPGDRRLSQVDDDPAEPLVTMQRKLQKMGASHYLLEKWGKQEGLYRFHCEVPLAGNGDHCRYFEATDTQPDRAVRQVLREVEQWQAGRYRR